MDLRKIGNTIYLNVGDGNIVAVAAAMGGVKITHLAGDFTWLPGADLERVVAELMPVNTDPLADLLTSIDQDGAGE